MKKYATQQRQMLLAFLKEHSDEQFSVEELFERLCPDEGISISAIYRNISQMAAEGSVQRFSKPGSRKFLYQYVGGEDCREHLHLKCEKCGQIFHMDDQSMQTLLLAAMRSDGFSIDTRKTVLYGLCKSC